MNKLLLVIFSVLSLSACSYHAGQIDANGDVIACREGRISQQEAFSRLKRNADTNNHPMALLLTARMYAMGMGTTQNINQAKEYYEKAALTPPRFELYYLAIEELSELQQFGKLKTPRRTCPCESPSGLGFAFDNNTRCQTAADRRSSAGNGKWKRIKF